MHINRITNNGIANRPSFKGDLTSGMREIFANPQVSQSTKKLLWELSEVPYFCEAAEATPKEDLLALSKLVQSSQTNIPRMILEGDVLVVKDKKDELDVHGLLSLENMMKYNANSPVDKKKNLLKVLQSLPLARFEEDARIHYQKGNFYPTYLSYKIGETAIPISEQKGESVSLFKMVIDTILKGKPIPKDETVVAFRKPIRGKADFIPHYSPTPEAIVDAPMSITPETLLVVDRMPNTTSAIKKSIYNMSETPYFYNLIRNTSPNRVMALAEINHDSDNLIGRMLSGNLVMDVAEPRSGAVIKYPIIDVKRLLADKKYGIIKENDFLELLNNQTYALEICNAYMAAKKQCPNDSIKKLILESSDDSIQYHVILSDGNSIKKHDMVRKADDDSSKRMKAFLDKVPYKIAIIDINEL